MSRNKCPSCEHFACCHELSKAARREAEKLATSHCANADTLRTALEASQKECERLSAEKKEQWQNAIAVAKDLREQLRNKDKEWDKTASALLERAEKAERDLAEKTKECKHCRELIASIRNQFADTNRECERLRAHNEDLKEGCGELFGGLLTELKELRDLQARVEGGIPITFYRPTLPPQGVMGRSTHHDFASLTISYNQLNLQPGQSCKALVVLKGGGE